MYNTQRISRITVAACLSIMLLHPSLFLAGATIPPTMCPDAVTQCNASSLAQLVSPPSGVPSPLVEGGISEQLPWLKGLVLTSGQVAQVNQAILTLQKVPQQYQQLSLPELQQALELRQHKLGAKNKREKLEVLSQQKQLRLLLLPPAAAPQVHCLNLPETLAQLIKDCNAQLNQSTAISSYLKAIHQQAGSNLTTLAQCPTTTPGLQTAESNCTTIQSGSQ